jgi:hypothetical protein
MTTPTIEPGLPKESAVLQRAVTLLKATHDLLQKQRVSSYVLNILAQTAFYDDAECDGECLMEDIEYCLDDFSAIAADRKREVSAWPEKVPEAVVRILENPRDDSAQTMYEDLRAVLGAAPVSAGLSDEEESDAFESHWETVLLDHPEYRNYPDMKASYWKGWFARALSSCLLPPDWVAVPEFPTQPMRDAGNKALDMLKTEPGMGIADRAYYAYTAMIAAAPSIEGNSQQAKPMPPDGYRCADCGSYALEPMPKEG